MPATTGPRTLRIAVSFGAMHARLARLLACQRSEDPDTSIALLEVFLAEQLAGIEDGRYDVGVVLGARTTDCLKAQPFWHDELAVAVPVRSPLLAYPAIPLSALEGYPVVMWHPDACMAMHHYVQDLFEAANMTPQVVAHARSFEFMAVLVAAGYGIGLAARSWIDGARGAGIVARPLHADGYTITASLLYCDPGVSEKVARFVERALR